MKIKPGFTLRDVCGEYVIVAEGRENIDFCNIISLNESSAYLWKKVQQKPSFTVEDLAIFLTEEYDVDMETAVADSQKLTEQWLSVGIVDD
ncbi:PqqD family protein [Prevotella sp. OH937_COT-195]|uniref:PqqD family protein n=1 Tax=Prevotella sp. OH937_COT-195 TaxID=2491051 RepID=UPI000F6504AB|nr:PqqD family protein [Prevotella sp. OH937_COT-195]RRC99131.1 PqqD family protein [Prevotella sp. OH937_COT-195]